MVADHDFEGGRTLTESIRVAKYLEKVGVDGFDLDLGCYEEKQWVVPTPLADYSCMVNSAAEITFKISAISLTE